MRTEQIYYALMVEQCGSFSKAATLLYVKQQSVRMAINNLEDELGLKLFERTSKGVYLNTQGKEVIAKLKNILDIYEDIKFSQVKQEAPERMMVGVNTFGLELMRKAYRSICDTLFLIHIF